MSQTIEAPKCVRELLEHFARHPTVMKRSQEFDGFRSKILTFSRFNGGAIWWISGQGKYCATILATIGGCEVGVRFDELGFEVEKGSDVVRYDYTWKTPDGAFAKEDRSC